MPPRGRGFEVGVVRGLDLGRPLEQQVGRGEQGGVLGRGRGRGEEAAGGLGPPPELLDAVMDPGTP